MLIFATLWLRNLCSEGYGMKTWKTALAGIGDQCNQQLFCRTNMIGHYKKIGFQPVWVMKTYMFTASCALARLASIQLPPGVNLLQIFTHASPLVCCSILAQPVLWHVLTHPFDCMQSLVLRNNLKTMRKIFTLNVHEGKVETLCS